LIWALKYGEMLRPYICDSLNIMRGIQNSSAKVIFEGQLGALRDIFYGIYPYTTSSSTIAAFGAAGAGCFSRELPVVTGIMKAFSTCVGEGPFVTEIFGETAEQLRETSMEFGSTTGRPRRIGHFDAVASRYGIEVNGAGEVALTKLDSLTGRKTLKICTHYRIGQRTIDYFPILPELLQAEPVYLEMPGWDEDIRSVRRYESLPPAARDYVEMIEKLVGCRIAYISVGPQREEIIVK
jgi:adenylosuccinate synthase